MSVFRTAMVWLGLVDDDEYDARRRSVLPRRGVRRAEAPAARAGRPPRAGSPTPRRVPARPRRARSRCSGAVTARGSRSAGRCGPATDARCKAIPMPTTRVHVMDPQGLQRRAGGRRPLEERSARDPQPAGRRPRPPTATHRLLERTRLRAQRHDVEGRRPGVPADTFQRRGLRRGEGAFAGTGAVPRVAPVSATNVPCAFITVYHRHLVPARCFSWFPPPNGGSATLYRILMDLTEPVLAPMRRVIPAGRHVRPVVHRVVRGVVHPPQRRVWLIDRESPTDRHAPGGGRSKATIPANCGSTVTRMEITPRELRDVEIRESFRGYSRDEVNELLERAAATLDAANERMQQMSERLTTAQSETGHTRETEDILHRTLLLAQRAADEAVGEATAKARQMLDDAEIQSRRLDRRRRSRRPSPGRDRAPPPRGGDPRPRRSSRRVARRRRSAHPFRGRLPRPHGARARGRPHRVAQPSAGVARRASRTERRRVPVLSEGFARRDFADKAPAPAAIRRRARHRLPLAAAPAHSRRARAASDPPPRPPRRRHRSRRRPSPRRHVASRAAARRRRRVRRRVHRRHRHRRLLLAAAPAADAARELTERGYGSDASTQAVDVQSLFDRAGVTGVPVGRWRSRARPRRRPRRRRSPSRPIRSATGRDRSRSARRRCVLRDVARGGARRHPARAP